MNSLRAREGWIIPGRLFLRHCRYGYEVCPSAPQVNGGLTSRRVAAADFITHEPVGAGRGRSSESGRRVGSQPPLPVSINP